jgi:hypothetical protein
MRSPGQFSRSLSSTDQSDQWKPRSTGGLCRKSGRRLHGLPSWVLSARTASSTLWASPPSRPNCVLVPSLMYHDNGRTSTNMWRRKGEQARPYSIRGTRANSLRARQRISNRKPASVRRAPSRRRLQRKLILKRNPIGAMKLDPAA